jgi:chorismate mutase/prephenate dehydratase
LLALLNRRAALALEVGESRSTKARCRVPPRARGAGHRRPEGRQPGPLKNDSVAPIWREIMSACRSLESPTRVAYLGPAGTFSEEAALGFFGSSIVRVPCGSFDEVFRSTSAGAADFGVVPVENSTEGGVARALDLFLTRRCSSSARPASSCATTCCASRIRWPASRPCCAHPQALAQCHEWLSTTCPASSAGRCPATPKARAWPAWTRRWPASPASARQRVRPARGGPAIQDDPTTARASPSSPTRRSTRAQGHGPRLHQPGGVGGQQARRGARPAGAAEEHGVSMTRFESRPARSGQWEYYFYIDLEGHPDDPRVAAALRSCAPTCAFFKVLGSYPVDVH